MTRSAFPLAIVAFLDILGFSSMVDHDCKNPDEPKYLPKVVEVLNIIDRLGQEGVDFTQFSDSIVLSLSYSRGNAIRMMEVCAELQYQFAVREILLRGAISFGRHYVSQRLVYSSGLVQAYYLESRAARFPRILVDDNLLSLIEGTGSR